MATKDLTLRHLTNGNFLRLNGLICSRTATVSNTDEAPAVPGKTHRSGGNAGPAAARIPRQRSAYARALPARPTAETADVDWLRDLARGGELGRAIAAGHRPRLRRAAFQVSYQIVFDVVTRRVELTIRGHRRC